MKTVVVVLLVLLAVLHQDFWWWDDRTLVFGFMPVGLAWHAAISLVAGLFWWLATVFCWPQGLDAIEAGSGRDPTNPQEESPQ